MSDIESKWKEFQIHLLHLTKLSHYVLLAFYECASSKTLDDTKVLEPVLLNCLVELSKQESTVTLEVTEFLSRVLIDYALRRQEQALRVDDIDSVNDLECLFQAANRKSIILGSV